MAPTFVDLFCGIGGFRIGLEAAGFECVYANDIDKDAVEIYKKNRNSDTDYPVECADIRDVFHKRLDNIPPHHVLAAGFPCKSFALQGNKLGDKCPEYGDLGEYVVKVAAAKRPLVVFLENVAMFLHPGKPWYKNLEARFRDAGFVCSKKLILAAAFGLPQNRKRGLIVAVRKDVHGGPFKFPPTPKLSQVTLRAHLLAVDCEEIEGLRKFQPGDLQIKWRKTQSAGPLWEDIIDKAPKGLRNQHGLINLGSIKELYNGPGSQIYHDLGHHPCIVGRAIRPWILTWGADDEGPVIRRLHPHEARRIQGFPDDFELHHTMTGTINQLGNAVPPPMVEWVGRAVAKQYREAFVAEDVRDVASKPTKRKSSRKWNHKPSRKHGQKHGRKYGRKRSHKSTHRSRNKSSHSHTSRNSSTSTNGHSHRSSRKRRVSSDSDVPPPPKRQHRQPVSSPDSSSRRSTGTVGFDGNTRSRARLDSQSSLSTETAGNDGNANVSPSPGSQFRASTETAGFDGSAKERVRRRHRN